MNFMEKLIGHGKFKILKKKKKKTFHGEQFAHIMFTRDVCISAKENKESNNEWKEIHVNCVLM